MGRQYGLVLMVLGPWQSKTDPANRFNGRMTEYMLMHRDWIPYAVAGVIAVAVAVGLWVFGTWFG